MYLPALLKHNLSELLEKPIRLIFLASFLSEAIHFDWKVERHVHFFDELLELNGLLMSLGIGGIVGVLGWVGKLILKNKNIAEQNKRLTEQRFKMLEAANVAILHNEIYKQCSYFIEQGEIAVDDLDNLEYLWRGYHGLGGNGTGELLYNRVRELPLKGGESHAK